MGDTLLATSKPTSELWGCWYKGKGGSQGVDQKAGKYIPAQNEVLEKLPPGLPDQQRWLGNLPGA
eukprot:806313-Pelagomonas_calceolata.AAC.2